MTFNVMGGLLIVLLFQQSDVHYSVLSLLLCLADSPTNATYCPVDLNASKVEGLSKILFTCIDAQDFAQEFLSGGL